MQGCPDCGGTHSATVLGGSCPSALLQLALAPELDEGSDEYEIEEWIGEGGMGVVYRAHQHNPDRWVALKRVNLAGREARVRFLREVELLGRFEHPNIVRIYDAKGMHSGDPYYTMQLIEGGSLATQRERFAEPRRAARLMATVARAVQFCHDARPSPVLHRDIKPENILLGPDDHPYLSDFGIAKAMDVAGGARSANLLGTIEYMPPEVLLGCTASERSDVYSLGAVLYELLTGQLPFGTGSVAELTRRIVDDELVSARQRVRGLDRRFDVICRAALEKEPERRYPSAASFADDLERVLRDEEPQPPMQTAKGRTLRWIRRHPLVSVGLTGLVLLMALVCAGALSLLHEQEQELLQSARQINTFAARAQAGAMLNQLRQYAALVERAANGIEGAAVSSEADCFEAPAELPRYAQGFDGLTILSRAGVFCSRFPEVAQMPSGRSFAFRDYFRGASTLGRAGKRGAYLSPAFRSETQHAFQFALSAPLFDLQRSFRGVLLAMLSTDSVFGQVTIDDRQNSGRITALLAPRGLERADPSVRVGRFVMLIHPRLEHGAEFELPARFAALLHARFGAGKQPGLQLDDAGQDVLRHDDYRDPIPGFSGRWLAAFAPVGNTGYVVLVQSPHGEAARASYTLGRTATLLATVAVGGLLGLWFVTFRLSRRRRA